MLHTRATRFYQGAAGQSYHYGKRAIPDAALPWVARQRSEKLERWIRANDVVFEYGVGAGWNLAQLHCRKRYGFDISEFLAPAVRARRIEFVSDLASIEDGAIDVVLCHHTLEHVVDPPAALWMMRRMLRPQGRLLLFVPQEYDPKFERFRRDDPNHHLYSWNVQTLGNLVEEVGFRVIEGGVGRFGYDRVAAIWATRLRIGEVGFRILRRTLHAVKPGLEIWIVAETVDRPGIAEESRTVQDAGTVRM
jgi:SAM-dependent methyltransferase